MDGYFDSLALFDYATLGRQLGSLFSTLEHHLHPSKVVELLYQVSDRHLDKQPPHTETLTAVFGWASKAASLLSSLSAVKPAPDPSSSIDACPNLLDVLSPDSLLCALPHPPVTAI